MDILGRQSFAFDDHTNVNLVAGTGYAARERDQFKELTPLGQDWGMLLRRTVS
jgi:hypothetical protein